MRYGYFRIYILLRREGWVVNHKRAYRLYREDGVSLRLKRPRRHVSAARRERQPAALAPNEMWSMDFVSDALFDGRRLRALTVVDAYTREMPLKKSSDGRAVRGDRCKRSGVAGLQVAAGCLARLIFASLRRFWAAAARWNSSRAPWGPRNRSRSSRMMRLR